MAIIIEQHSKCPICQDLLDNSKEYILVPPITSNIKDPLFLFSDVGVHLECLNKSGLRKKLFDHINLYDSYIPPSNLRSIVNGLESNNTRDVLFFGLLTSTKSEELYQFNYIAVNLKNLKNWSEYDNFILIARRFLLENKWQGFNKLEYIINKIQDNY